MGLTSIDDPDALRAFLNHTYQPSAYRSTSTKQSEDLFIGHDADEERDDYEPSHHSQDQANEESFIPPHLKSTHLDENTPPAPHGSSWLSLSQEPTEPTPIAVNTASQGASINGDDSPYSPRAVHEAFYDFVQTLDGKSLDQSIWAPKRSASHPSQRGASSDSLEAATAQHMIDASTQTDPIFAASRRSSVTDMIAAKMDNAEREEDTEPPSEIAIEHSKPSSPSVSSQSTVKSSREPLISTENKQVPSGADPAKSFLPPHLRLGLVNQAVTSPVETQPETHVHENGSHQQEDTDQIELLTDDQPEQSLWHPAQHGSELGKSEKLEERDHTVDDAKEDGENDSELKKSDTLEESDPTVDDAKEDGEISSSDDEPEASTSVEVPSKPAIGRPRFDPMAYRKNAVTSKTEDRTDQLYFSSWGVQEQRDRPPSVIRTVILKNLPLGATPAFVASVVFGGALEQIHMRSDDSAAVRFLSGTDCLDFYNETDNGLVYGKEANGKEKVIWTHLGKEVDVVGGNLEQWISMGRTRCIKAVHVDKKFTAKELKSYAEAKGRVLEGYEESETDKGYRVVIFRFTKIEHAVAFRVALGRDDDWEQCNINFSTDPCEPATGPRTEEGQ